jgi:hypothetical protein
MTRMADKVLAILACLAISFATACSSRAETVIEKKQRELAATATAARAMGATAARGVQTSGQVDIILHDFHLDEKGYFASPEEGMLFLVLDVTFKNNGVGEVTIGSRHMRMVDAAGNTYRKSLVGGSKASPDSTIGPGESTTGEIVYEVPKHIGDLTWLIKAGDEAEEVCFSLVK